MVGKTYKGPHGSIGIIVETVALSETNKYSHVIKVHMQGTDNRCDLRLVCRDEKFNYFTIL